MVINARPWFCPRAKKGGWKLELRGGSDVARNFKRGGHNFYIFSQACFFGRTKLKLIEKQERLLGGSGRGMLSRKFFENLRAVMAILALFE